MSFWASTMKKRSRKKNWYFPDKLEIFFRKTKKWTKCHLRVKSKWRFSILKICYKNNRSAIFTRKRYFVQFWTFLEITKKSNFWPFSKYGVKISTIPKISKLIFLCIRSIFRKKSGELFLSMVLSFWSFLFGWGGVSMGTKEAGSWIFLGYWNGPTFGLFGII